MIPKGLSRSASVLRRRGAALRGPRSSGPRRDVHRLRHGVPGALRAAARHAPRPSRGADRAGLLALTLEDGAIRRGAPGDRRDGSGGVPVYPGRTRRAAGDAPQPHLRTRRLFAIRGPHRGRRRRRSLRDRRGRRPVPRRRVRAHLVSRRAGVTFYAAGPRRWTDRLTAPMTPLGPGWKKLLCVKAPLLFHASAGAPADQDRAALPGTGAGLGGARRFRGQGRRDPLVERRRRAASTAEPGSRSRSPRRTDDSTLTGIDHVVAGTGYDIDVRRLPVPRSGADRPISTSRGRRRACPRISKPRCTRPLRRRHRGRLRLRPHAAFRLWGRLRRAPGRRPRSRRTERRYQGLRRDPR